MTKKITDDERELAAQFEDECMPNGTMGTGHGSRRKSLWPSRFGVGSTVIFFVDGSSTNAVSARVLRVVDRDSEMLELEVHLRGGVEQAIAKRAAKSPRPMCTWDFIA